MDYQTQDTKENVLELQGPSLSVWISSQQTLERWLTLLLPMILSDGSQLVWQELVSQQYLRWQLRLRESFSEWLWTSTPDKLSSMLRIVEPYMENFIR